MRAMLRASTAERAIEATVRGRRAIARPATGRAVTRPAGTAREEAAGTATHRGATPPAITLPITIHEQKQANLLNAGLLQQARRWTTSTAECVSRKSLWSRMLVSGAGRLCAAQDAQSKPLEQWLAQLKDPDAAQRRAGRGGRWGRSVPI